MKIFPTTLDLNKAIGSAWKPTAERRNNTDGRVLESQYYRPRLTYSYRNLSSAPTMLDVHDETRQISSSFLRKKKEKARRRGSRERNWRKTKPEGRAESCFPSPLTLLMAAFPKHRSGTLGSTTPSLDLTCSCSDLESGYTSRFSIFKPCRVMWGLAQDRFLKGCKMKVPLVSWACVQYTYYGGVIGAAMRDLRGKEEDRAGGLSSFKYTRSLHWGHGVTAKL